MSGPALVKECVALSVSGAGSTPKIGLFSGLDAGSGLRIADWMSCGGFDQ